MLRPSGATLPSGDGQPFLEVRNLRTRFHTDNGVVKAVDGISFEVARGERIAIAGESGSGKSVTALSIMRLIQGPAGRILSDTEIIFKGRDLLRLPARELQRIRGGEIGMVFQDPLSSLNPVSTVGSQIEEAIRLHKDVSRRDAKDRAIDLLAKMGIPRPELAIKRYAHEFSGGMRQRVMIAMAISCGPDLLIADEPTTALDVTIQAQIMDLLMTLAQERNMSVILITHDLGLVAGFAERILVMYAGRLIEAGMTDEIFYRPEHPYASALLQSVARLDRQIQGRMYSIRGTPPNLISPPTGCAFHPRCTYSDRELCTTMIPELVVRNGATHQSACHYAGSLVLTAVGHRSAQAEEPESGDLRG